MGYFFKFPRELVKTERMAFLNQSFKITFVRHPFVRLVSTFQDKLIGRASFQFKNSSLEGNHLKPADIVSFLTHVCLEK